MCPSLIEIDGEELREQYDEEAVLQDIRALLTTISKEKSETITRFLRVDGLRTEGESDSLLDIELLARQCESRGILR